LSPLVINPSMQNTRLNSLFDSITDQIRRWFFSWWRFSLDLVALLLGVYAGIAITGIAGQYTSGQIVYQDMTLAGIVVAFTEVVNWAVYSGKGKFNKSLPGEVLNSFKIGLTYGLFVLAFLISS